jgi:hypothetical protein
MKKITKTMIRIWIALTSVLGLIFGWAALAHSQKPVSFTAQADAAAAASASTTGSQSVTLEPIPSLNQLVGSAATGSQSSITINNSAPSTSFITPRLRTRGS